MSKQQGNSTKGDNLSNFMQEKRLGYVFIPRIALLQEPHLMLNFMKNVLVLQTAIFGDKKDSVLYLCASPLFQKTDNNTPKLYDMTLYKSGKVEFHENNGDYPLQFEIKSSKNEKKNE